MAKYTLSNVNLNEEKLFEIYEIIKKNTNIKNTQFLDIIFKTAISSPTLFPGITGVKNDEEYLNRWVKSYGDAENNPPSKRIANPKSSCTDPAIRVIVKNTLGLSDKEAIDGEYTHNLFMSAENIQGNLLEEYIDSNISSLGFVWCKGNVLRAIDFCSKDGKILLQIKNKSNTENSSSSNIRSGTTIEKWYRLGTKTENGEKKPAYKWENLNKIINKYLESQSINKQCAMSEESYIEFIKNISSKNKKLITKN